MNCPYCNKNISETAKFCTGCGKTIPHCPACGQAIIKKKKFCPACGYALSPELIGDLPDDLGSSPQPVQVKYCKRCGNISSNGTSICDACQSKEKKPAGYDDPVYGSGSSGGGSKSKLPIVILLVLLIIILAVVAVFVFMHFKKDSSGSGTGVTISTAQNTEDTDANTETESTEAATQGDVSAAHQQAEKYYQGAESAVLDFDGHAYVIFNYETLGLSSYDGCERYCESMGGHLAVINSQEENDAIYDLVTDSGLTIAFFGYSDEKSEGNWEWVDGSDNNYTNWCKIKGKTQPNNGAANKSDKPENYAEFYKETANGMWNDAIFGTNTYRFVCEWE